MPARVGGHAAEGTTLARPSGTARARDDLLLKGFQWATKEDPGSGPIPDHVRGPCMSRPLAPVPGTAHVVDMLAEVDRDPTSSFRAPRGILPTNWCRRLAGSGSQRLAFEDLLAVPQQVRSGR